MGLFHVGCKVLNPAELDRAVTVSRLLVDTGSEATWIKSDVLQKAGITPRKIDMRFQMANGQIITRSVGYAVLKVDKSETVDEVVFAQNGDMTLLGARALEGLNLKVDSRGKKLVASGPLIAATVVPPSFGKLISVANQLTSPRRKKVKAKRAVSLKSK